MSSVSTTDRPTFHHFAAALLQRRATLCDLANRLLGGLAPTVRVTEHRVEIGGPSDQAWEQSFASHGSVEGMLRQLALLAWLQFARRYTDLKVSEEQTMALADVLREPRRVFLTPEHWTQYDSRMQSYDLLRSLNPHMVIPEPRSPLDEVILPQVEVSAWPQALPRAELQRLAVHVHGDLELLDARVNHVGVSCVLWFQVTIAAEEWAHAAVCSVGVVEDAYRLAGLTFRRQSLGAGRTTLRLLNMNPRGLSELLGSAEQ